MFNSNNNWNELLKDEFEKDYFIKLEEFIKYEYENYNIFPEFDDVFNAFKYTSFSDLKVVILGQDPYIKKGQAHGLSFSVQKGVSIPPSLKNIYKEMKSDVGIKVPTHGCLTELALQGVMLLNSTLTVREDVSNSHKGKGFETFTNNVISLINLKNTPVVFMLWGNSAISKAKLITNSKHLVLTSKHPSPLAGGAFFGCKHFSKANEFLTLNNIKPINWQIND